MLLFDKKAISLDSLSVCEYICVRIPLDRKTNYSGASLEKCFVLFAPNFIRVICWSFLLNRYIIIIVVPDYSEDINIREKCGFLNLECWKGQILVAIDSVRGAEMAGLGLHCSVVEPDGGQKILSINKKCDRCGIVYFVDQ